MDPLSKEMHSRFYEKFEEIYLDFVKTTLTISAATVAAIVIFSNRFDQGQIPIILSLSMVGFLFSVLCGATLQFYMCIDISSFLDRLAKSGLAQEDVHIDGTIRMKSSKKFLTFVVLHSSFFFLSFILLLIQLIWHFWKIYKCIS